MGRFTKTVLLSSFWGVVFFFFLLCGSSVAQECNSNSLTINNTRFTACNALPVLSSFLHWNYHQSNNTVDIAYRHTGISASNWVVWSLNPTGSAMLGAQCLVAIANADGSVRAYTSPISTSPSAGYQTRLEEGNLTFGVSRLSADLTGNQMTIYATIELPGGRTSLNQVWQHGDLNSNRVPTIHQRTNDHLTSFNTIDFSTGATSGTGAPVGGSRQRKKNVHGVLNAVSWGILMPIGAITARYLKVFKAGNPAWFYLHVACQASAYAVGVAGWGTGIKLGSDSPGIEYTTHRNIGIALFALGTLQVFALLLRPKPDHKYRFYWNLYHWGVGYTVIILSIINIFKGFDALGGQKDWKRAYIGVIIFLGAVALILEALTWFIVIKRKKDSNHKHPHNGNGSVNGA